MFFKKIHLPLRFIQLPFQAFSVYWCFLNSQLLWVTTFLMTLLSALQVMHSLRMACILSKFFNYRPPRWKNIEHVGPSIHQSAHVNMNAHIFSTRMGQAGGSAGVKDKEREAHHACLPHNGDFSALSSANSVASPAVSATWIFMRSSCLW